MDQKIYKTLFVLLILSLFSARVEVSFVMAIIAAILSFSSLIHKQLMYIVSLLSLILMIGLIGVFCQDNELLTYIKDIVYYSRPIIVLIASYNLIKRINDKEYLFTSIIVLGFIYAIIHVIKIAININNISSVVDIRIFGDRYNHVELIALIFILTLKNIRIRKYFSKLTINILIF